MELRDAAHELLDAVYAYLAQPHQGNRADLTNAANRLRLAIEHDERLQDEAVEAHERAYEARAHAQTWTWDA